MLVIFTNLLISVVICSFKVRACNFLYISVQSAMLRPVKSCDEMPVPAQQGQRSSRHRRTKVMPSVCLCGNGGVEASPAITAVAFHTELAEQETGEMQLFCSPGF